MSVSVQFEGPNVELISEAFHSHVAMIAEVVQKFVNNCNDESLKELVKQMHLMSKERFNNVEKRIRERELTNIDGMLSQFAKEPSVTNFYYLIFYLGCTKVSNAIDGLKGCFINAATFEKLASF